MGIERFLAFGWRDPLARSVRHYKIALLIVHQIGFHNLIEHLFMHSRIENRDHRFDPSIEIARHQIG